MNTIIVEKIITDSNTLSTRDVVTEVHSLFTTIGKMEADEVVAAYQTVEFLKKGFGFLSTERKQLKIVQEALLVQMKTILDRSKSFESFDTFSWMKLRERFQKTTGEEIY